jgi:thioesterase domain-containing protein
LLVTIQPLGEKPPIFFIPGIGGEVLVLRDLAVNLGNQQPIWGLQGAEYSDPTGKLRTVEQVAEQYAQAVRAAWPHGPYRLAGYSFGGHLALEIARRVALPGEREPLVVLIDTFPPVPGRNTSLLKRVRIHWDNLSGMKTPQALAGYLRARLRRLYLRLFRHAPARAIVQQLSAPGSSPRASMEMALAAYKPQPYAGRVVLFKARQREWYVDWDPMDDWKTFISGKLEVHTLPGEHNTLIKNPYAVELARQLQKLLGD